MIPVVTKTIEYTAVLGMVVGGTLWIGNVADRSTLAIEAVSVLPALSERVATLDERTKNISQRMDELKTQQTESEKRILDAIERAKHK